MSRYYSYPFRLVDNEAKIDTEPSRIEVDRILSTLLTHKTERVLRPDYGNTVQLFDPTNEVTAILYNSDTPITVDMIANQLVNYVVTV